jgi:hypothetical protein
MLAAFALSAVVQYNDPDPLGWILVYAAAAAACATGGRGPGRWLAATVGAVALVWSLGLAPGVVGHGRISDAFARMEDHRPIVEETREMLGLALVAAWMAVLALRGGPGRSKRTG